MTDIRISVAGLARIKFEDKFLLGLNKSRLNAGKKIYTPFGGALEFYASVRPFLLSIEAIFEKGNDLRFSLPEHRLSEFEGWFYKRIQREISPYRELREEFVDEEKIFSGLSEDKINSEYLITTTEVVVTDKPGQEGRLTKRFFEIYNVTFSEEYKEKIITDLKQSDTHLGLLTEKKILSGMSDSGIEIAPSCKSLIIE